jgi:CubicO group peptidase (beta-lactamase class C family)
MPPGYLLRSCRMASSSWRAVTVRQLLSHTGGIPDYTRVPGFMRGLWLDVSPQDVIESVAAKPLDFEPGTRWSYSNTDYFLLGMIVEKASGSTYAQFLHDRIFEPLGMTSTQINDLGEVIPKRAAGYAWGHDRLRNEEYVSPSQKWAAGAAVSSVQDLARWEMAIASGKLLRAESWRAMEAPVHLKDGTQSHYGFANELEVDHGHRVAGNQGGAPGFDATLLRYPDDGLSVIVLTNLRGAESRVLARRIASLYLPVLSVAGNRGIEDPDPRFTERFTAVLEAAARGEVDETQFTPQGQTEVVPMIRRAGPQFIGPLGILQSLTLLESRAGDHGRVLRYRASYASRSIIWTIEIDASGEIASMDPQPE